MLLVCSFRKLLPTTYTLLPSTFYNFQLITNQFLFCDNLWRHSACPAKLQRSGVVVIIQSISVNQWIKSVVVFSLYVMYLFLYKIDIIL
jgi:hypothetical protein